MSNEREELAAYAHEAWVGWMRYFLARCADAPDGSVVVPADYESALLHLMDKSYADLSEEQKDNDRKEADRMLAIVGDSRAAAADVTQLVEDMATRIVDGAIAFDQWTGQDGHATWNAEQFVIECRERLARALAGQG